MLFLEKFKLTVSQIVNTFLYGGDPDESLSARAWRQRHGNPDRHRCIDRWFGLGHCKRVFEAQEKRIKDREPVKTDTTMEFLPETPPTKDPHG